MIKKFALVLSLIILLSITGCRSNVQNNLPPLKVSGAMIPKNGTAIYKITDNGKKKGEEKLSFKTKNGITIVKTDIALTTTYLDEKTLLPEKIEATYTVNGTPSYVKIVFENGKIRETIKRNEKTKTFNLPMKNHMYPDDVLHFILQGTDFNFTEAYIYDFFPYTSLEVPCVIKNVGREKISINGKNEETYHLVVDFGKKKRNYWISVKTPHLLLKREENGVLFTLQRFLKN